MTDSRGPRLPVGTRWCPLRLGPIFQHRLWGGRRLGELLNVALPANVPIGEAWIDKLRDILGIEISGMIFVGDALRPGGNDHPVHEAGVTSIATRDPNETKRLIEVMVACSDGLQRDAGAPHGQHQ